MEVSPQRRGPDNIYGSHLVYIAMVCCLSAYKDCWSGTELVYA